ncbi:MAG: OmpA family protein, partial [Gammaproteobacteria bacterium]|nr:OmpA family protein [Gammaproteobacteria bacterium]
MMMNFVRAGMPVLLVLVLVGCGGQSTTTQDDDDLFGEYGGGADAGADASTSGMTDDEFREGAAFDDADSGGPIGGPAGSLENRVVYFDFDLSDVSEQYLELLAAHGRYLAANDGARVRLEGHADERGSREYNIALGDRRAQSV